ncbi:MAG: gluconate 2-dehydrogenase gamma chain [Chloroflexi bacterium]|nr:gluconate 2-dehydrogenase gamma chain [Chloroflexota bacterium]
MTALTRRERRTLDAIAARIFPATDTPGAVEVGAVDYVDRALAGAYRRLLPRYRRGLGEIERHSIETMSRSFTELVPDEQDAVLLDLEAGRLTTIRDGAELFRIIRRHVLEGVFCEPQYGGNRDLAGWRLVGFPGQQHGYANAYINKVVDIPPIAVDSTQTVES